MFLNWLHEDQHTVLADCTQTNIDSWFTTGNHGRQSAVGFIVWAKDRQLCDRRLQITPIKPATPPGMPHQARVELIRRLLTDTSLRLDDRVAGLLVALYAQPTSRICRLQRHDITITETGIQLKIGGQPIAPIEPFATLLKQLAETANHQWLFPGDIPGEPIGPNMISQRLRRIGLNRNTRIGALHDLIQQIPGPVLAELIGYNPNFVAERALTLAAPWTNYPNVRQRT